jgi:uncharacterized protein YjbI with pentapeptide repeats
METKMIGNKIAEARKKINISQAQLARRLFISPQAVGKWERGESIPDIITVNRLAQILEVDLNYFSENFRSLSSEEPAIESLDSHSDEVASRDQTPPPRRAGNKLRWNMSSWNWVDADFSGLKNLVEKFSSSNMQRCLFIGSDMSGLQLKSNNVDSCDFSASNLRNAHIQDSNLQRCKFAGSDMSELLLKTNNVENCDFSGSSIKNSRIQNSNLSGNLFSDCSLIETEISNSYIMACDFTGADFTGASFKSGGFQGNPAARAVWNRSSFNGMKIADMVFEGTMQDCYFEDCAFSRVTFRNSTLINTFFKNKSLKRISFIDCKADRMTYEFLKIGKANLDGITLITI